MQNCKTKTNRNFEMQLASSDIYLCSDWPLWLISLVLRYTIEKCSVGNCFVFAFTLLCYAIGLKKQKVNKVSPIKCKTKSNHDLVTCVFPRFARVTCACFAFSLVHWIVYVCDWLLSLLFFWVSVQNRSITAIKLQYWKISLYDQLPYTTT